MKESDNEMWLSNHTVAMKTRPIDVSRPIGSGVFRAPSVSVISQACKIKGMDVSLGDAIAEVDASSPLLAQDTWEVMWQRRSCLVSNSEGAEEISIPVLIQYCDMLMNAIGVCAAVAKKRSGSIPGQRLSVVSNAMPFCWTQCLQVKHGVFTSQSLVFELSQALLSLVVRCLVSAKAKSEIICDGLESVLTPYVDVWFGKPVGFTGSHQPRISTVMMDGVKERLATAAIALAILGGEREIPKEVLQIEETDTDPVIVGVLRTLVIIMRAQLVLIASLCKSIPKPVKIETPPHQREHSGSGPR
jgi:hypothetical protein